MTYPGNEFLLGELPEKSLKPFFTFFGGKWRIAKSYPPPKYDTIIEPFAGSAGYSVRYYHKNIILYEIDPKIYLTWKYLISVRESEILALPDVLVDQTVDDLKICEEARYLIGWWLNKGAAQPCKSPGAWMRQNLRGEYSGNNKTDHYVWGDYVRNRISEQVKYIRHWKIFNEDFSSCLPYPLDMRCTWFIDPPYKRAGRNYKFNKIDYNLLSCLCQYVYRGQIIVCENDNANWLPFIPFRDAKASESSRGGIVSKEMIYYREEKS